MILFLIRYQLTTTFESRKNMTVYNLKLVLWRVNWIEVHGGGQFFPCKNQFEAGIFLIRFKSDFSWRSSRIVQDYAVI